MIYPETHAYLDAGPVGTETRRDHLRAHTNHSCRLGPGTAITGAMIERHSADPERFIRYLPTVLGLENFMPGAGARGDARERWRALVRAAIQCGVAADVVDTVEEITAILAEMDSTGEDV